MVVILKREASKDRMLLVAVPAADVDRLLCTFHPYWMGTKRNVIVGWRQLVASPREVEWALARFVLVATDFDVVVAVASLARELLVVGQVNSARYWCLRG